MDRTRAHGPASARLPGRWALLPPLLGLMAVASAIERPAPLFVNLGPGDTGFARGFREGWERDGLQQTGETAFRWTLDGARLVLPLRIREGHAVARLRLARFADVPADITLVADGRIVDHWTQAPRGWRVHSVEWTPGRNAAIALQFRSQAQDGGAFGVALDWVEVDARGLLVPEARLVAGLLCLLLGVPLLLALAHGRRAGLALALLLEAAAVVVILLDRLGGVVALAAAGPPALLVVAALLALGALARRARPALVAPGLAPLAIPLLLTLSALVALAHPFFYYPDVDTHARFLREARQTPALLVDTLAFQRVTGGGRGVGDARLIFPYSTAFHALALILAPLLGEVASLKTLAAGCVGVTALGVHALALALGLPSGVALVAQALFALLPVVSSRLTLALYPTLFGQALEALLLVFLARRWGRLGGSGWLALGALLAVVLAAYTGSIYNALALVAVLAVLEAAAGVPRKALALVGLAAVVGLGVVGALYGSFLVVLWRDVLPHLAAVPPEVAANVATPLGPLRRLAFFYDAAIPLLVLAGLAARPALPAPVLRVLVAALVAGLLLSAARPLAPALFRDAKEIELLAVPVAVLAAAGAMALWRRGGLGRAVAVALVAWATGWGILSGTAAYAERFFAAGR